MQKLVRNVMQKLVRNVMQKLVSICGFDVQISGKVPVR